MMSRLGVWLRPRSNGLRVGREAYRLIRSANKARSQADWTAATALYRLALEASPSLAHIWIQLGHAAKESGQYAVARDAYDHAAQLDPRDPEPHLFLGHMAKRNGSSESAGHYLAALRRAPENLSAAGEVMQHILLGRRTNGDAFLDEALQLLNIEKSSVSPYELPNLLSQGALFFDVSDLLAYFAYSRIPSGVQRVQIEVMLALLSAKTEQPIALSYYSPGRQCWSLLSPSRFGDLCAASLRADADGRDSWQSELRLIYVASALSEEILFPRGSVLISFSASSPDRNYLLDIRTVCERDGISYVPLIYDLIPMLNPNWVVPAHFKDFSAWLHSMLRTAKGYIAISQATRGDLLALAKRQNVEIDADLVRVVSLDGKFAKRDRTHLPLETLDRWELKSGGYVLFVSTIEPRKNHVGAFKAWLGLAQRLAGTDLPQLVCVGGKGWLNDPVHEYRAKHPLLKRKILILSGISDQELDLLYRNCAFTLYPSFYEGWGLPVTESLCYSKVPAISNTSSMPEAGGQFAVYFDPHNTDDMIRTLTPLIVDAAYRRSLEARIDNEFTPRSWEAIGLNLSAEARAIAKGLEGRDLETPIASPNILYRLSAFDGSDKPGEPSGEIFRHGRGWYTPEEAGCSVMEGGAALRLRIANGGPPNQALEFTLSAENAKTSYRIKIGTAIALGDIEPGCRTRVKMPIEGIGSTREHHEPNSSEVYVHILPTGSGRLHVVDFSVVPEQSMNLHCNEHDP